MPKKSKIIADYGSLEIYRAYCKKYKNPYGLTQKEYTDILNQFYKKIFDMLIFKGAEFTMPYRLGNLRIKKQLIKPTLTPEGNLDKRKLRPDWKSSKLLWAKLYPNKTWEEIVADKTKPLVYHENKHTNRYAYGWHWDKSTCTVHNNTAYSLDINRTVDRYLASVLKNPTFDLDFSKSSNIFSFSFWEV